jgi:predicted transcriptional regulator
VDDRLQRLLQHLIVNRLVARRKLEDAFGENTVAAALERKLLCQDTFKQVEISDLGRQAVNLVKPAPKPHTNNPEPAPDTDNPVELAPALGGGAEPPQAEQAQPNNKRPTPSANAIRLHLLEEDQTSSDLAAKMGINRASVNQVLGAMLTRGLVHRTRLGSNYLYSLSPFPHPSAARTPVRPPRRPGELIALILGLLEERGPMMAADIAARLDCAADNVNQTLINLVRKGRLERSGNGTPGRPYLYRLPVAPPESTPLPLPEPDGPMQVMTTTVAPQPPVVAALATVLGALEPLEQPERARVLEFVRSHYGIRIGLFSGAMV